MQQDPNLRTSYSFTDFAAWTLLVLIPVLTAIYSISRASVFWTVIYIIVLAGGLAAVYRFFCTHCPHYKNSGNTTKCIFMWKMPAFFAPRTGPQGFLEKSATGIAVLIVFAFPIFWLLAHLLLLLVYVISWAVLIIFLYKYECVRCIYKDCPMNRTHNKEAGQ